jgi:hypothetical protein
MPAAFNLEIGRFAAKSGVNLDNLAIASEGAKSLSEAIRIRVQMRGDLAGQKFPGWKSRRRFIAVAPGYPDRASGGKLGPSGARFYENAAAYHRANSTQPGTYDTTGGMWSGLSVVIQNRIKADIMFRGRSQGRDPNFKRRTSGRGGKRKTRVVAKSLKINNALKAWTVFAQHRVNVLNPSDQEGQALAEGALAALAHAIGERLPVKWDSSTVIPLPPDQAFARRRWG